MKERMFERNNHTKLPGIGMRIIKSAIAVALCFVVSFLRGGMGMMFYSQLAALWCIQMYRSNTKKNAIQRTVGTCIGAIYGLIYLLLYPYLAMVENTFTLPMEYLEMVLVPVMIILVLYTTVLLQKTPAAYFSCVVFLSIAINHATDMNPYLFVWNRFLDTMIGIAIGIVVNDARFCFHPDRETLYISGLDDILVNHKDNLSAFSRVELNRMIDDGMRFTISTKRTPASMIEPLREVHLNYPVIAMDGAVLYDVKKKAYLHIYIISKNTAAALMQLIQKYHICWYGNVIIDDMLVIYYDDTLDEVNCQMVEKLRTSPYRNYVKRPLPKDEDLVYFMLLDNTEKIENFYQVLREKKIAKDLKILCYPSVKYPGYSYIKIYNKNATKENMIAYLKNETKSNKIITFGTIAGQYDVMVREDNFNEMVRKVRRLYEPAFWKKRTK